MNGHEKIVDKILEEAKLYASATVAEAQHKAKALVDEQINESNREKELLIEKAKSDANDINKRLITVAKLEERKMMLSAKQKLVDEAFVKAHQDILAMPDSEYLNFCLKICENITSNEEVLLSNDSYNRIGEQLKTELKNIAVIKSDAVTDGGLIIRNGKVENNYTVGALIRHLRDEISDEVVKALF